MVDSAGTTFCMSKVTSSERGGLPWLRTYPSCLDRSKTDKANDRAGLKQYLVNMMGEGQCIGCTVYRSVGEFPAAASNMLCDWLRPHSLMARIILPNNH